MAHLVQIKSALRFSNPYTYWGYNINLLLTLPSVCSLLLTSCNPTDHLNFPTRLLHIGPSSSAIRNSIPPSNTRFCLAMHDKSPPLTRAHLKFHQVDKNAVRKYPRKFLHLLETLQTCRVAGASTYLSLVSAATSLLSVLATCFLQISLSCFSEGAVELAVYSGCLLPPRRYSI